MTLFSMTTRQTMATENYGLMCCICIACATKNKALESHADHFINGNKKLTNLYFYISFFLVMDSQEKFASLNLAIVLSNGSVWDISFDDKFMAIKKKLLIQLPYKKYTTYLPFSTNLKVLNFVRNDLKRDIIQYHKKLNKQGHMTIGKSSLPIKLTDIIGTNQGFFGTGGFRKNSILVTYKDGVQVGNMFWVFNASKHVTTVKVFECKLGSGGPRNIS